MKKANYTTGGDIVYDLYKRIIETVIGKNGVDGNLDFILNTQNINLTAPLFLPEEEDNYSVLIKDLFTDEESYSNIKMFEIVCEVSNFPLFVVKTEEDTNLVRFILEPAWNKDHLKFKMHKAVIDYLKSF